MSITTRTLFATTILVVSIGLYTFTHISHAEEAAAKAEDNTVAIVNGVSLTKNEFESYVVMRTKQQNQPGSLNENQRKALLEEYINRELIYQDAIANQLDKVPGIAEEIENQRRNILASYSVRRIISQPPSNEAMRKAYQDQYSSITREYNAKHILVASENEAMEIIAILDKGGDFGKLAAEKSLDTSGQEGGDLGWFALDQMVKPFGDATAALKKGEYTKTPVQTEFGWHVIKLENIREVNPPEFDQVREQLRNILQNQMISDYVARLREKGKIEVK